MNDNQRKFLIEKINQKYKSEKERLNASAPKKPSLNNYLIAAALDGSLEYRSMEEIKESIRQKVLNLGPGDGLLGSESGKHLYGGAKYKEVIMIEPEILFRYPANYVEAYEKYSTAMDEYSERILQLSNIRDTLEMKINLGSNRILDKLIEQADNLADLNLVNSSLILTAPDDPIKQLKS